MNKKIVCGLLTVAFLAVVGMTTSCKKDDEDTSKNRMIGTWNVQYIGSDDNENGSLEESEKEVITDTSRFTFTFKEGGTGETVLTPSINTGVNTTVPFTWSLDEAANKVTITANNETNVVSLLTLNQNVFSGVYGEGQDKTWLYATR